MSAVLLDTNILVDFLRDHEPAIRFLDELAGKPAISVVTIMELVTGARSRKEEARIAGLESILSVLPVSAEIARGAGQNIKHYQPAHGLDDLDAIIAATAEHHGLKLATLNIKHFPMFPRLKPAY